MLWSVPCGAGFWWSIARRRQRRVVRRCSRAVTDTSPTGRAPGMPRQRRRRENDENDARSPTRQRLSAPASPAAAASTTPLPRPLPLPRPARRGRDGYGDDLAGAKAQSMSAAAPSTPTSDSGASATAPTVMPFRCSYVGSPVVAKMSNKPKSKATKRGREQAVRGAQWFDTLDHSKRVKLAAQLERERGEGLRSSARRSPCTTVAYQAVPWWPRSTTALPRRTSVGGWLRPRPRSRSFPSVALAAPAK